MHCNLWIELPDDFLRKEFFPHFNISKLLNLRLLNHRYRDTITDHLNWSTELSALPFNEYFFQQACERNYQGNIPHTQSVKHQFNNSKHSHIIFYSMLILARRDNKRIIITDEQLTYVLHCLEENQNLELVSEILIGISWALTEIQFELVQTRQQELINRCLENPLTPNHLSILKHFLETLRQEQIYNTTLALAEPYMYSDTNDINITLDLPFFLQALNPYYIERIFINFIEAGNIDLIHRQNALSLLTIIQPLTNTIDLDGLETFFHESLLIPLESKQKLTYLHFFQILLKTFESYYPQLSREFVIAFLKTINKNNDFYQNINSSILGLVIYYCDAFENGHITCVISKLDGMTSSLIELFLTKLGKQQREIFAILYLERYLIKCRMKTASKMHHEILGYCKNYLGLKQIHDLFFPINEWLNSNSHYEKNLAFEILSGFAVCIADVRMCEYYVKKLLKICKADNIQSSSIYKTLLLLQPKVENPELKSQITLMIEEHFEFEKSDLNHLKRTHCAHHNPQLTKTSWEKKKLAEITQAYDTSDDDMKFLYLVLSNPWCIKEEMPNKIYQLLIKYLNDPKYLLLFDKKSQIIRLAILFLPFFSSDKQLILGQTIQIKLAALLDKADISSVIPFFFQSAYILEVQKRNFSQNCFKGTYPNIYNIYGIIFSQARYEKTFLLDELEKKFKLKNFNTEFDHKRPKKTHSFFKQIKQNTQTKDSKAEFIQQCVDIFWFIFKYINHPRDELTFLDKASEYTLFKTLAPKIHETRLNIIHDWIEHYDEYARLKNAP